MENGSVSGGLVRGRMGWVCLRVGCEQDIASLDIAVDGLLLVVQVP